MKSYSGLILGLIALAGFLTAAPARAEQTPASESCEVPDYLLASESALPKVEDAVRNKHSLDILVIGSRSSTINSTVNGSEMATAYPGRLQAALKEKVAVGRGQPVGGNTGQDDRRGNSPRLAEVIGR